MVTVRLRVGVRVGLAEPPGRREDSPALPLEGE